MRFAYEAMDRSGRRVSEYVDAATKGEAAESLRGQGLFLLGIRTDKSRATRTDPNAKPWLDLSFLQRTGHLVMFTQQMTMLLGAGSGVVPSLSAIERQLRHSKWRAVIGNVKTDVEGGATLADALARHPKDFDSVMVSMVAAGESSGTLGDMFGRLARMIRRTASIRNQLIGASIYPILLLFLAGSVVSAMLGFVLPRFAMLFTTLHVDLPASTAALLALGAWLENNWPYVLGSVVTAGVGLVTWQRSASGKETRDRLLVGLPGVGMVTRRIIVARIIRIWGLLLESKVPLLEAMKLSRGATQNTVFQKLFDALEKAITEGRSMVSVLEQSPLIMPSLVEGIQTGEQSGRMSIALSFLADQMEAENEQLINSLMRIIEPVILLAMGVVVGGIAMSLFLPLFDIASAASGGN